MPFLTDTCTGAAGTNLTAHTPDTGSAPLKHPSFTGDLILSDANRGRHTGSAQAVYYYPTAPPSADYEVSCDFYVKSVVSAHFTDLFGRLSSSAVTFYLARYNSAVGRWELYKAVAGTATLLGTYSQALSSNTAYRVKLSMIGSAIKLYIDGTARVTSTDTDVTSAGYAGLGASTSGTGWSDTTGIHFDNLSVSEPATLSVSPTTVNVNSTGNVLTLTGANTSWTPGTPGSPTFTVSGGTGAAITAQTVLSSTSAQITLAAGSAAGTLTLTDPSTGATTTVTVATAPPTEVAVNDATFLAGLSPYNWYRSGSTYVQSNCPGARGKWAFSGGTFSLKVDVSPLSGVASGSYPLLWYSVDNGAWQSHRLAAGETSISLGSGLGGGTHTVEVLFQQVDYTVDRWTTPKSVVRITGLQLDNGANLVAHAGTAVALRTYRGLLYGDSITEGLQMDSTGPTGGNARSAYPYALGIGLDAEIGVVGFGGQGWGWAGTGNVPQFTDAWNLHWSAQARSFSPEPDWIAVMHGTNDGINSVSDATVTAGVTAWIAAARAACPNAHLFLVVPVGRYKASAISAGVTAANDSRAHLLDLGLELSYGLSGPQGSASRRSLDKIHPDGPTHGQLAARLAERIRYTLGNGQSSGSGSIFGGGVIR